MIDGNPTEFVDRIYSCQDTVYIFKGIKYWFQGYMLSDGGVHMEIFNMNLQAKYVYGNTTDRQLKNVKMHF